MLIEKNKSKKAVKELIAKLNKELLSNMPQVTPIAKPNNPFRPFIHEKEILFNCIDRSLALLPDMFFEHKNMDADKVEAITKAIDKLLEIRKQFINDYFSKPFVIKEVTND